jgi:3-phosphoshikimate 1-carboxyvinyltransferase
MAPLLEETIAIQVVDDLKSKPLIHTTLAVLSDAGIEVEASDDLMRFVVRPGQRYRARTWAVNGDWPGTAAILAAAAVVPNSRIRLSRLREDEQGERRCLEFYRAMGCKTETDGDALVFSSPARLNGAAIDGDTCTDAVLAMMGAAALGEGESSFAGINNLQFKECDRVREPIAEMRKVFAGAVGGKPTATWTPDDNPEHIRITGAPFGFTGGVAVDGRGDHRVIMLLSILGLRCRNGLRINGAHHVAKSFPKWFDTLRAMGVKVGEQDDPKP